MTDELAKPLLGVTVMTATFQGQTHEAYDERGRSFPEDLPPNFVFGFFVKWKELDNQIDEINATKKALLANVRCQFGKHQVNALKDTMTVMRKDLRERTEELKRNEMVARYVDLIESELDARNLYA